MKILTNIRFLQTGGIFRNLLSFINFLEKEKKNIKIVGVRVSSGKNEKCLKEKMGKTKIISLGLNLPLIEKVMKKAQNLSDIKEEYREVIDGHIKAIKKEKPDVILINGTYYVPWCLLLAGQSTGIPMVLHYHGVLTKETQGCQEKQRLIFKEMERSFDRGDLFYIFPSKLTKEVVEKEVFAHKIAGCAVLPNPIPLHFFESKVCNNKKNIGIVSRWSRVKNTEFYKKFAKYNQSQGNPFNINIVSNLKKNSEAKKELKDMVKFKKPMDNEKLADFYRKMGVVISPSHFETYGNVAKESVASGTPALVSSKMGVAETFRKLGLNDWIIEFDSVKKVYKKVKNVIYQSVDNDVREKMREMYSPQKIYSQMLEILNSR